jgi:hypothetical protein
VKGSAEEVRKECGISLLSLVSPFLLSSFAPPRRCRWPVPASLVRVAAAGRAKVFPAAPPARAADAGRRPLSRALAAPRPENRACHA